MFDLTLLKQSLERLVAGQPAAADRDLVRGALESGAISMVSGERGVALGGNADGAVIVSGDGNVAGNNNVVLRLEASNAEALQRQFPPRTRQLPSDLADFAGRREEVAELLALLEGAGGRAVISSIEGMPGLGKTALAVHAGHQLAERYPDGQLFLELGGTSDAPLTAEQGLARLIRAFEPMAQLPDTLDHLTPIYRDLLRGKRVLVVLDNARDGDQVAPLLPPEGCGTIVTSRRDIVVSGLKRIDLGVMSPDEAADLLRSILPPERAEDGDLAEVARLCGYLPLALRVAGTFLEVNRNWSPAAYIEALSNERERLRRLKVEGNAEFDVTASLSLSLNELRGSHPDAADLWHDLSVFPGGFDLDAAADVWQQDQNDARDAMTTLLARHMVLYDEDRDRYRLHDLMRDLAAGHAAHAEALALPADLADRLERARLRHAGHYCQVLSAAGRLFFQGNEQILLGLQLFDQERANIEAGQRWSVARAGTDQDAAELCVRYPDAGA